LSTDAFKVRISNLEELRDWSNRSSAVWDILDDESLGRKRATEAMSEIGLLVSEKLIRTYREKTKERIRETNIHVSQILGEAYSRYSNPIQYQTSDAPKAVSPMEKTRIYKRAAKSIVIMPDVQAPLHDVALVEKFTRFLGDYAPDELAQVGDFTDSTEISRWVRGKKGEFAGDLQYGFDTSSAILHNIREVFDGRFRIVRSNHDDRLESYIDACAPGLSGLRALTLEHLAGFNEFGVEFIRDEVVELANGWVMAHGDEGSLSPVAGKTAFGLAKNKFGVSTVCGHTHRAGMTSESTGYNGAIRNVLTGLEVGHFMDLTKADYLKKKGVAANWQQAFGILEIHGDRVYPRLITVQDGRFSVDGVEY
jgi:hypothetical protein